MHTENLPAKLWQWIDAAEKDALCVADDPEYILDMAVWHLPDEGVCHVCLAGAVMARTLQLPQNCSSGVAAFPHKIRHPLAALDDLRELDFMQCLERRYPGGRGVPGVVEEAIEEINYESADLGPLEGVVERSDIVKFFARDVIVRFRMLLKQYDL